MSDNPPDTIADRVAGILERVEAAVVRVGRSSGEITLVAASKRMAVDSLAQAAAAGIRVFGESRVQEAEEKIPHLPSRLDWHFIGNLQSNKVRRALPLFSLIHSVGSLELACDINRIAAECGLFPKVMLQVNLAEEASKHGFRADAIRREMEALLALERLEILGVMGIPPFRPDPEDARRDFAALREFRDEIQSTAGVLLPLLSMGMSHDFEAAIEEGATHVRVGTAIFGGRS